MSNDTTREQKKREKSELALVESLSSAEEVRSAAEGVQELLSAERVRKAGVETRLATMVGLAPVASGLVLAMVAFVESQATAPTHACGTALGAYVVLQLVRTVFAAISGLDRRAYIALMVADVTLRKGEEDCDFRRRVLAAMVRSLQDHVVQNNDKVTQLAVAYRSIRNALGAMLIWALTMVYLAV